MVLVDTPVWFLSLRRRSVDLSEPERRVTQTLYRLVKEGQVQVLGPTRQEVLTGIRDESQFHRIRDHLGDFPNTPMDEHDYEEAASISNRCRRAGVSASPVDMLLCSVSVRHDWEIFTTDRDFAQYGRVVNIRLRNPLS
jgi:predicted nucleic acid-binding protein